MPSGRDGTLWAWGAGSYGQLGNTVAGNTATTPLKVNLAGVRSVAAGGTHALAVTTGRRRPRHGPQAGTVAATFTYDAYGNLSGRTGTADTPLRWNGQNQDTDTGLYYLRARYYDPATAQFLTRDPLEALTGQPYQYTHNSPLNETDRSGLDCGLTSPWDCAGAAARTAATAVSYSILQSGVGQVAQLVSHASGLTVGG